VLATVRDDRIGLGIPVVPTERLQPAGVVDETLPELISALVLQHDRTTTIRNEAMTERVPVGGLDPADHAGRGSGGQRLQAPSGVTAGKFTPEPPG